MATIRDAEALQAALGRVRDDRVASNWVQLGYVDGRGRELEVVGEGTDGLAGLVAAAGGRLVSYAFLRLDFELGVRSATKFVTVCWVGENIRVRMRASIGMHLAGLEAHFGHTHLTLRSDQTDLTPEYILRALNISAGLDASGAMFGRLSSAVFVDPDSIPSTHGAVEYVDYHSIEAAKAAAAADAAAMQAALDALAARHARAFSSLFFAESDSIVVRCIYPAFRSPGGGLYAVNRVLLLADTVRDVATVLAASTHARASDALAAAVVASGDDADVAGASSAEPTISAERAAELTAAKDAAAAVFADPSKLTISVAVVERNTDDMVDASPRSDFEAAADAPPPTPTFANTTLAADAAAHLLADSVGWATELAALRVRPEALVGDAATWTKDAAMSLDDDDARKATLAFRYRHLRKIDAWLTPDTLSLLLY